MYYNLSVAEMDHVSILHEASVKLINDYAAKSPIPEGMKAVYDYIHFYNNERIQLKTKLTPLEKRCQFVA